MAHEFTEFTIADCYGDEITVMADPEDSTAAVWIHTPKIGVSLTAEELTNLITALGNALAEAEKAVGSEPEQEIGVGDIVQVHGYTSVWEGTVGKVTEIDDEFIYIDVILSASDRLKNYAHAGFYPSNFRLLGKGVN